MKNGLYVTMIVGILAALLTGGCEFILGPDEAVGGGNLAIDFGESGNRGAAPADLERYEMVLTGPKEQKIEARVSAGEHFYQQVALGEWHIEAKAYNAGNVLIGTGSITVTVRVGRNEVRVPMQRVSSEESPPEDTFIAVTGITDVPTSGTAMASLTLTGTVSPANATNQAIVWSVKTGGGTGASISGNSLSTTNAGTVIVTATIANGATAGTDYAQDFNITINPPPSGTQMSRTISGVSVPFRYVPAGSFLRDGTAGNVTIITKGYWMGETTVTQELFQAVMGVNPSYFDGSSGGSPAKDTPAGESQERRPVENVSWYDAIAFCNKLSLVNGKDPVYSVSGINWATLVYSDIPTSDDAAWNDAGMDMGKNGYRLPTDMEWMWAAMGADTANPGQPNTTGWDKGYAGSAEGSGQTNLGDYAWYAGNSGSKTHEVGKKAANELELYDLSGNVWEYCWDWFVASIDPGTDIDPTGPTSGPGRVNRGGVWHYPAGDPAFRVARRVIGGTYDRIAGVSSVGFRVVCGQ